MNAPLNWRYATKKFDPLKQIPAQKFEALLESLRLSPSSFGLSPWKFIIVKNPALRQQLKTHAWNQSQVTDADSLIVFCSLKTMDENFIKNFIDHTSRVRGIDRSTLADYEQMIINFLKKQTPQMQQQWMRHQVYMALGMFLCQCAHYKIDACPMEGFDAAQCDAILDLPQQGVESVVLCAVGYRAEDDKYAALKKVRFDKSDVFIERL